MLWALVPVAIVVTLTPGAATAMIVRNALRGGSRAGVLTIVGNSIGVVAWALLSVLGISASWPHRRWPSSPSRSSAPSCSSGWGCSRCAARAPEPPRRPRSCGPRDGLITSLANPKLAVFFVALFPQFVGDRASVLPTTLAMAALIVAFDLLWYTTLAVAVSRAKQAVLRTRLVRWMERVTGTVLLGLGVRVALESR